MYQGTQNSFILRLLIISLLLFIRVHNAVSADIAFGAARTIANGYDDYGYGMDAADLNADGYVDIIHGGIIGEEGGVFLKSNDRTIQPSFSNKYIGSGGVTLKAADLNGDGANDILGGFAWYENKGPFGFIKYVIPQSGMNIYCTTDLDGDGDLDLFGVGLQDPYVAWQENKGGIHPDFVKHILPNFTTSASFLGAGDLDDDGDVDVVISTGGDPKRDDYRTIWLENDGAAIPNFTYHVLAESRSGAISLVDFNHDGRMDVLVGSDWFENNGARPPIFIYHQVAAGCTYSALGDLNGDGWMDYVSHANWGVDGKQWIYWFEHNGNSITSFTIHTVGQTEYVPYAPHAVEVYLKDVVVADVDRDGDVEPILNHYRRGIIWFPNLRLSPRPVSLFEPSGGEWFKTGTDMPVSWRTDVAQAGTTVTLDLWRGTGQRVAELAAADSSPSGVGFHNVRLPVVPPANDYRVRAVSLLNPALFAFSDGTFTISSANPVGPKYWLHYR